MFRYPLLQTPSFCHKSQRSLLLFSGILSELLLLKQGWIRTGKFSSLGCSFSSSPLHIREKRKKVTVLPKHQQGLSVPCRQGLCWFSFHSLNHFTFRTGVGVVFEKLYQKVPFQRPNRKDSFLGRQFGARGQLSTRIVSLLPSLHSWTQPLFERLTGKDTKKCRQSSLNESRFCKCQGEDGQNPTTNVETAYSVTYGNENGQLGLFNKNTCSSWTLSPSKVRPHSDGQIPFSGLWAHSRCLHHSAAVPIRTNPRQASLRECLSVKNEARCRRALEPNGALYEKDSPGNWAAVLVSLCLVEGEPAFLFTLRSSTLKGRHKGDVSFAGGKRDPSDGDVVDTALREAREEMGITVAAGSVWGVLKPLRDWSGMIIAPVIANLGPLEALNFRPNPAEVDEIFTISLSHLCSQENRGYTHFRKGEHYGYTLPVFRNGKHRVWGLTATALDHTLKVVMPP
ncbi:mitochondrial coenzyme A diphosphatase NUDT8 isoform X1 [Paramormyrops kingsleyae]|uniref:mitochondrial coenzyme A diphosphatase NUDT8 isoform X1 n=1 Tax=Paramormyrops kingsleyae TaxID=1676925 RepID=UPI003B96BCEB